MKASLDNACFNIHGCAKCLRKRVKDFNINGTFISCNDYFLSIEEKIKKYKEKYNLK